LPPRLGGAIVPGRLERLELLQPERLERLQVVGRIPTRRIGRRERVDDLERELIDPERRPIGLQRPVWMPPELELRAVAVDERGNVLPGKHERLAVRAIARHGYPGRARGSL